MALKRELLKYFISGGVGLAFNTPILIWITDVFGKQITATEAIVPAYTVAYWISYGMVGTVEFFLRKFWVFDGSRTEQVLSLPALRRLWLKLKRDSNSINNPT